MNSLERVAFHEAGHALLMIHFKMPFEYISIIPNPKFLGHIKHTPNPETDINSLVKEVMVLYAGTITEQIYLKRNGLDEKESNLRQGASGDSLEIKNLVQGFFPEDEEQQKLFVDWVFYRTMQKVKKAWPSIEILAKALLKKPVITYQELRLANPAMN